MPWVNDDIMMKKNGYIHYRDSLIFQVYLDLLM